MVEPAPRDGLWPEWQLHSKSWGHSFHPMCSYMAMFPPRIPHYFIQKFTRRGDVVLDPFNGAGTTCVAAKKLNRNYLGIDISQKYCETAERRLKEIL